MTPDDIKRLLSECAAATVKLSSKPAANRAKKQINKSLLPTPTAFYQRYGITLKSGRAWQMAKCIFHDDKHASMGINTQHGGFYCHACGEKGDMIKFYMRQMNVDFKTACVELGLYEVTR